MKKNQGAGRPIQLQPDLSIGDEMLYSFLVGVAGSITGYPHRLTQCRSYRADHAARMADANNIARDVRKVMSTARDVRELA